MSAAFCPFATGVTFVAATTACLAAAAFGFATIGGGAASAVGLDAPKLSGVESAPRAAVSLELRDILADESLASYSPDPATARNLTVDGYSWTVVSAKNAGVCLQVETGAVTCGGGENLAAGRIALTRVESSTGADAERLAAASRKALATGEPLERVDVKPTPAVRRGLVPDGISSVRSIDSDGRLIASATVQTNAYVLELGLEGRAARVQFLDATGKVISTNELN